jgi:uncharacterized protein (TIGR02145 family)
LQLSADIVPKNASNQTLAWRIEGSGASLDDDLLLTAHAPGDVVIHVSTQDGSGKHDEWPLRINELGVTSAQGASGEYYDVYCYPNLVGCWMIQNSKEGTYDYDTYSATPYPLKGDRGYYYSWTNAQLKSGAQYTACPTGYHVPDAAEWGKLLTYVNTAATPVEFRNHWRSSAAWAGYRGPANWYGWNEYAYWWSSAATNQHYDANGTRMSGPSVDTGFFVPVRCVRSN